MDATPDNTLADPEQRIADLERQLADRTSERDEALAREAATAEVLQVINASPGDLAPVFDAIVEEAIRLCEATNGHLFTYDGDRYHPASIHGDPNLVESHRQLGPFRATANTGLERICRGERLVHIPDVREVDVFRSMKLAEIGGFRSTLSVALRRDEVLLGALVVYRREVRPFSDKQIALLKTFAAQAVIAMENARLLTETREALKQQTATAEVLGVINASPGDLTPVFEAMLEKATRLCEAKYGLLATYDGDMFHGAAAVGFPMEIAQGLSRLGHPPAATVLGRLEPVQLADISSEPSYAEVFATNPVLRDVRTSLSVPMLKEGELIGAFNVFRLEVRPFTDRQIALLDNFAGQAVIAMENARLLTEQREALEQQTAMAEGLCCKPCRCEA